MGEVVIAGGLITASWGMRRWVRRRRATNWQLSLETVARLRRAEDESL